MANDATHPKTPDAPAVSPWLTIEEARREVKCGAKLLYREIRAKRLRAARLCGRSGAIRIHRDWVREWLERCATPIEVVRR